MAAAANAARSCPACSSTLQEYLIHLDTKMIMCENVKCAFPFDQLSVESYIEVIPNASRRYGKKRTAPSSVAKNFDPAAVDRVQSANECGQSSLSLSSQVNLQTDSPLAADVSSANGDPFMIPIDPSINTSPPALNTFAFAPDVNLAELEELLQRDDDDSLATPKDSTDLSWFDGLTGIIGCNGAKLDMQQLNEDVDSLLGLR